MKFDSFRYEIYMAKESFRDILAGFLEENEPISPRETLSEPAFQVEIPFEIPLFSLEKMARKHSYPPPPQRRKPSIPVEKALPEKPKTVEPSWTVEQLSATEQNQVQALVKLGAHELSAGKICLSQLKKAHRRLAKQLHPDAIGAERRKEEFLRLQSIYEGLSRSLLKRASESACGNESASAQASQRQDAA